MFNVARDFEMVYRGWLIVNVGAGVEPVVFERAGVGGGICDGAGASGKAKCCVGWDATDRFLFTDSGGDMGSR